MSYKKYDNFSIIILIVLFTSFFLFCVIFEPRSSFLQSNDWDVLIFTQNWPSSVCREWKEKSPNSTCNMPSSTSDWTIHGIWPTKLGTLGPYFCDPSRGFSPEDIYGIIDKLNEHWSRIETHKNKFAFWKHEWDKHGTCAAQLDQLNSELKYFYQGLKWNNSYNITDILQKANVSPGNQNISAFSIIQAVKAITQKDPFVSCYTSKEKDTYLLEVRLCFDKTLTLTNCDGVRIGHYRDPVLTDCPADKKLLYPQQTQESEYEQIVI